MSRFLEILLLISVELILKKLSLLDALKGEPFWGTPWRKYWSMSWLR